MFGGGAFLLVQEGWCLGEVKGRCDDQDLFFVRDTPTSVHCHDCNFLLRVGGTNVPIPTGLLDFFVVFCEIGFCKVGCGSNDHHFCAQVHELPPKSSNVRVLSIIGYIEG